MSKPDENNLTGFTQFSAPESLNKPVYLFIYL